MIRLIAFLVAVAAFALGFSWLADNPGEVRAVWFGQEIRFSILVATIALGVIVVGSIVVWSTLTGLIRTPGAIGAFFTRRRRERGWRALSRGMVAVGAGDARAARRLAAEARRVLGAEPMALLLEAQSAQAAGDHAAARAVFQAMMDKPETRLLGLRGLYVEASRGGETLAARHFAEEAHAAAPALAWAGEAQMQFEAESHDYEAALATLERNIKHKVVDKAAGRRLRAVLLTARARELEDGQPEPARTLAIEAHTLAPELVPAALTAARLLVRAGDVRRASRVLEATWRIEPHPDVADAYLHVRPGDSVKDRLARAKELVKVRGQHVEAALMLARAELEAHDHAAARTTLKPILEAGPSRRACLLMAEVDEAAHGGVAKVREWLARAVRAPRDAQWIADGQVFEAWAPVSPLTGKIDAFVWAMPPERASREERAVAARLAETALPAVVTTEHHAAPVPASPVAPPPPAVPTPDPGAVTTVEPEPVAAPVAIVPPSPDDPGPDAGDIGESPRSGAKSR